ncbi:alpha/beta fold hydrolase [Hymenobacter terrenus]|uniref:alpha/beta fold hydrolase n=1 Tax=Hymenobacter terrenus TaxID=1629124 RepID=UPI0006964218|nr:alpha/beta hydrolase [Hymenobacter terrenus]
MNSIRFILLASLLALAAGGSVSAQTRKPTSVARGADFRFYADRFEWVLNIDVQRLYQRDSIPLYVAEFGAGPDTLVFVHGGFGAEHSALLDAFLYLAQTHHLIFYDQRGSLRSYCPDSLISLPDHVRDLERLRRALGTPRLNLVGHSMGTLVAMSYAQAYPKRVNRLVMVGALPAKVHSQDKLWEATQQALADTARNQVIKRYFTSVLHQNGMSRQDYRQHKGPSFSRYYYVRQFLFAAANIHRFEQWRHVKGCYLYKAAAGSAASKTTPAYWDFTAMFAKLPVAATIIHGRQDFIPIQLHRDYR